MQLLVLTRLTRLLDEAGYHELAISIWQALIEYQFLRPGRLQNADSETTIQAFEEFWESEVPRVGEPGALGWDNFSESMNPRTTFSPLPSSSDAKDQTFREFYELEYTYERLLRIPGRTMDDQADLDPYRVVLFTDISPLLNALVSELDFADVVQELLRFFDLPGLSDGSTISSDRNDSFLCKNHVRYWKNKDSNNTNHNMMPLDALQAGAPPPNQFAENVRSLSGFPLRNLRSTAHDLFHEGFPQSFEQYNRDFLKNVLRELSMRSSRSSIAEYCLAFVAHFYPKELASTAKLLLQEQPSSLRLYAAYASAEVVIGNESAAAHILSTALRMSRSVRSATQQDEDEVYLWHASVWRSLRTRALDEAMSTLITMSCRSDGLRVSESTTDASEYAMLDLTSKRDQCFARDDFDRGVLFAECLAILQYLRSSQNLSHPLEVFHQTHVMLHRRGLQLSTANELIHQAQARLLSYNASQFRNFRPSIIRDELQESLRHFPNNSKFLVLYAANERQFRINDRVRMLLDSLGGRDEDFTVVTWLFAIYMELQRPLHAGSTWHSIRSRFERAAGSSAAQNCVAFWRSYVEFEAACTTENRSPENIQRLKRVYFRGLTHLPWSKDYMMVAFSPLLLDEMSISELRGVWNVMVEKDIRIHIDLEDIFTGLGQTEYATMALPDDPESD